MADACGGAAHVLTRRDLVGPREKGWTSPWVVGNVDAVVGDGSGKNDGEVLRWPPATARRRRRSGRPGEDDEKDGVVAGFTR